MDKPIKKIYSIALKISVAILLAFATIFIFNSKAFACTGVYVGSDVSKDGTILIARSNDTTPVNKPAIFKVYGGADGEKLTSIDSTAGFHWTLPEKTYRTIVTPSTTSTDVISSKAAINECGVSVSATVTGYCCPAVYAADPYVDDGINEGSIPILVGMTCSTAKEGIDLLAQIIDNQGSCEDNILMISDQQEAWYMEIYAGHQYCAVKAPDDCVAVTGNEFMLETVDEKSDEVVCSPRLFSLPQEKGFAQFDSNGKMNLFNTYSGTNRFVDYCHLRTWRGQQLLAPSTSTNYSLTTKYPLFFKPDKKVDITDVMDIYRDRYDGTEYSIDKNGDNSYRAISTTTSQTTQILQTYKNLPANFAVVDWCAFSNAEFNVFVPFSNIENKFDDSYTFDCEDYYNTDLRNAFVSFRELNTLAAQNREKLGSGVKKYWNFMEKYSSWAMNEIMQKVDSSSAKEKLNDFCSAYQNQTYYDSKRLSEDVNWHLNYIEQEYTDSVSFKTFIVKHKDIPEFSPYVDAALVAKIYGWNIDDYKLQDHSNGDDFDKNVVYPKDDNEHKNVEAYIKISNGSDTVEVHTNNGHRNSNGEIIVNGETKQIPAKIYDGKCYVDFSFVEKLNSMSDSNSFSMISQDDISSKTNLENNFWTYLLNYNIPNWAFGVLFVVALVACFIILRWCRVNKK